MLLNTSKGNSSMKAGNFPSKSPRHSRKKRINSEIKSSHKLNLKKNDCCSFEEFPKSNVYEESCAEFSSLKKFNYLFTPSEVSVNDKRLKRSYSFPMVYSKLSHKLFSSKSCNSLQNNEQNFDVPQLQMHHQSKTLDNLKNISNIKNEKVTTHFSRNNSIESTFEDLSESRRSSNSTMCKRHNSTNSEFSEISIIDMKEIEGLRDNEHLNSNSGRKAHHSRSKSDVSLGAAYFEEVREHPEVFSLPSSFSELTIPPKKNILEEQVDAPSCSVPRPQQRQSLYGFLSSEDFNVSAELDRENAHFCISEAIIAAIEHMKCTRMLKIVEEENESDEEIRKLTQRIRIRKKEKQREKVIKTFVLLSDGRTDTTTSQSASPPISSHSSDFDAESIGSEDEIEDLELSAHTDSNLSSIKENGLSLSMASLYSDADILKPPMHFKEPDKKFEDTNPNNLSAESVALSLLRKFSEKHLPKASELKWIVTEQEAPQMLLPLPNSWPISPDAIEEESKLRLRGNFEWAPPRPQIILSILPSLKKKDIMEKQNYRCAGCGMKIEKSYVNRFRYCNYFGKYFCQCCHNNGIHYIPGRIIWKWDFTKYYVSKFAWGLLDQINYHPLINIEDINSNLYKKVRQLEHCRILRTQLFYLKNFMTTCRKAKNIQDFLASESYHILHQPHVYSLSDLVQVKSGELARHLRHLINPCVEHVKQCILCQAKGFICEICGKEKDIIFPFQLDKVVLCQVCGCCFHKKCFKNVKCPRCERIAKRRSALSAEKEVEEILS
ncbi:run domain Beclin-1-interacting and cysteine-rich domain-containing protein [Caerostris darwini]|uniref:Run domain Beclin-1-interacting and cysteine-rich domain-containing protein n=1 Tax=Caerostris darwini TaxID=1538125 RepID=A0AAV4NNS1_9ARAC|nr:run domain Beclin-1-interacting and cysteine-rich domain-containing protein [Caerostris darwini]